MIELLLLGILVCVGILVLLHRVVRGCLSALFTFLLIGAACWFVIGPPLKRRDQILNGHPKASQIGSSFANAGGLSGGESATPRPEQRPVRPAWPVTPPPTPEATETPDQRPLNGERYPQTRQHLLTMDDVKGMSLEQIRYAINEVYARYGAMFPNAPHIQRQFQKFEWYHPNPGVTFEEIDRLMSDTERQNVKLLAKCRELKRSK
jgi:hypothetical protein